jgi:hypothetical protein
LNLCGKMTMPTILGKSRRPILFFTIREMVMIWKFAFRYNNTYPPYMYTLI